MTGGGGLRGGGGSLHVGETATAADGTHPTAMLSCCSMYSHCAESRTYSIAHLPLSSGTR